MDKEKPKKKNIKFFKFIYLLLFLSCILFCGAIYYLNLLPFKYFILVVAAAVFIIFLFALVLLNRRVKKFIKFFFSILAIIIMTGLFLVSKYSFNVKGVINDVTKKINYKTENYDVIVLDNSNYEDIKDLENKELGYLDNGSNGIKKAKSTLKKQVNTSNDDYDDVAKLSNDLLNKKIDAILVEETYKSILDEESDKFKSSTKVLYEFSVKIPEEKNSKKVDVTKEPFNVYISGIDTYGKITSVSRSDVNIIATVNPQSGHVLLTSVPRDYYVQLRGTTGLKDKLTHAGIYGVEKSVGTLEDLINIKINYYLKVNFTSVVKIVDTLGGITIHSDYNFISQDGFKYVKGDNKVNGERALSFARERHSFNSGDIQRGKNQMYVIQGMADELMSFSSVTKFNSLLSDLDGTFETNISSDEISKLIKMQIDKNINWNIENNTLDGTGAKKVTYTAKSTKAYVMVPDVVSVASATTKIEKVMHEKN